ncbi:MAG: hypothetical protein ABIN01_16940 [Ferruginibacter sp.]
MWWIFVISLITIPVFIYFDNGQISENDLTRIDKLILSENSYYNPGGGKGSTPSLKLNITATNRTLVINYEEYSCVTNKVILDNFKQGDTISIKIDKSNLDNFYSTTFLSKFVKLYGLTKNNKDYISLSCRNKVSTKKTNAATNATIASAILSLIFALFILRPKTKYQAVGQFPIHPILIVLIVWLVIYIAFR